MPVEKTDGGAQKHDQDKPPLDLLAPEALLAIARVLAFGAKKYGRRNWEKGGLSADRLLGAALRHIMVTLSGELRDAETGELHLAHALCELMFALALHERGLLDLTTRS